MKRIAIMSTALLMVGVSFAQDAPEISSFVTEYISIFNDKESEALAQRIFVAPAQIATFALLTTDDVKNFFDQVYEGIEPDWDHSIINSVDVYLRGRELAFVDLNYSRLTSSGELIPPNERASFLVVRKVEGDWRISGLYPHDASSRISCEN